MPRNINNFHNSRPTITRVHLNCNRVCQRDKRDPPRGNGAKNKGTDRFPQREKGKSVFDVNVPTTYREIWGWANRLGWLLNPRGCYGDGTARRVTGRETEGCCLEGSSVWSPYKGDDVLRSVCLASRFVLLLESAVLSRPRRRTLDWVNPSSVSDRSRVRQPLS